MARPFCRSGRLPSTACILALPHSGTDIGIQWDFMRLRTFLWCHYRIFLLPQGMAGTPETVCITGRQPGYPSPCIQPGNTGLPPPSLTASRRQKDRAPKYGGAVSGAKRVYHAVGPPGKNTYHRTKALSTEAGRKSAGRREGISPPPPGPGR